MQNHAMHVVIVIGNVEYWKEIDIKMIKSIYNYKYNILKSTLK